MVAQDIKLSELKIVGNHRKDADKDLQSLMQSMKQHGLIQPIVVCANGKKGRFCVVAGHRRYHAAKKLGWKTIPCVIREEMNNTESEQFLVIQFNENSERLNPTLEDQGRLLEELTVLGLSHGEIAVRTSQSVGVVRRTISAYKSLPLDIRQKTKSISGKRIGKNDAVIPISTGALLGRLLSSGGDKLTPRRDEVIKYAEKPSVTKDQLRMFAALVSAGKTNANAQKMVSEVNVVSLRFLSSKKEGIPLGNRKAFNKDVWTALKRGGVVNKYGLVGWGLR